MDKEAQISITRAELASALRHWETEAKVQGWANRVDEDRSSDEADYLVSLILADRPTKVAEDEPAASLPRNYDDLDAFI